MAFYKAWLPNFHIFFYSARVTTWEKENNNKRYRTTAQRAENQCPVCIYWKTF